MPRDADVPFRVGHHFASELVNYGRTSKLKPADIPFDVVKQLYAEAVKAFDFPKAEFPLTLERFRTSLTAQNMLASSRGLGGPQRAETVRMLAAEKGRLDQDAAWLKAQRDKLARAQDTLDRTFSRLGQ